MSGPPKEAFVSWNGPYLGVAFRYAEPDCTRYILAPEHRTKREVLAYVVKKDNMYLYDRISHAFDSCLSCAFRLAPIDRKVAIDIASGIGGRVVALVRKELKP